MGYYRGSNRASQYLHIVLISFVVIFLFLQYYAGGMASSGSKPDVLSTHEMSLNDRYPNSEVNTVFKENILLTLAYLSGVQKKNQTPAWPVINQPFNYSFELQPGQTFSFHDDVLPTYQLTTAQTTHAHFDASEGFLSDGYLVGDGVCHLASLIYWAAKDAGLQSYAPTNHDFANIPEVPKQFGVAIYDNPADPTASAMQNLYITNNFAKPVIFKFEYDGKELKVSVMESN